ncbi:MAG: hypothetical protein WCR72_17050, partial [Bacteroidota bacterium]
MRNTIPLFAIVTALLLLSGCRKSPALETASVPFFSGSVEALVSLKSVSFTASFTGLDPAKAENCGFEWSENPARTAFSVNAITDRYGKMKASAVVKLNEGTEYQVRAWVLTGSKKFYSAPSLFYGVVAVRPEIVSLGRTYALWSDSVRIRVRNLSADIRPQDVKVIIQYTELQPVSVDTNEIVVLMPYIQDKGKLKLRVLANGHEFANSTEIENALPAITSVDPGWIHYGDTIHVKGNFRAEYAGRLIPVASYDLSYELLTFTNSEITLKVPPDPYCSQSLNIDFNILSAQGGIEKHYYFTGFGVSRFGHWSKLNYALPEMGAKSVLFNNEAYMIEYSVYTGSAPFWKYNPATDQWTALNDYPAPGGANQTLVVCNGELYSGFAT